MATVAIDKLARKLVHVRADDGASVFNSSLFQSLNKDHVLQEEILDPLHHHIPSSLPPSPPQQQQ